MTDLKDAFAGIAPVDWSDVPKGSLSSFLKTTFSHAETLANSVPLPPNSGSEDSKPSSTKHASSAADTVYSPQPTDLDRKYAELQKPWGKPIKINAKDNPLNVSVYKTAGHDRRGAWFSRRSVHAGLSYARWKSAMQREFPTSLKVKKGPGSGAIRGIAGDKRIEKETVEGVGNAEVWLLSSSFPGPVAPRDFCGLISTSDNALTEASDLNGKRPRHWMVVSRPTTHSEAEQRDGLVRGQYESVELMRDIPGSGEDEESNLIEWIMITRSDPGGGIPRFMVERGTPGSIVADVPKFIDWAIHRDDSDDHDVDEDKEVAEANEKPPDATASRPDLHQANATSADDSDQLNNSATDIQSRPASPQGSSYPDNAEGNSSLLGNLTTALGSTVGSYLPYFGGEDLKHQSTATTAYSAQDGPENDDDSSSTSSSGSDGTFASADEGAPEDDSSTKSPEADPTRSVENIDLNQRPESQHDKEMHKLKKKRIELDHRIAKAREQEGQKLKEAEGKEGNDYKKAQEKATKDRRKEEERYQKEVRNLEERRKKQERKTEENRVKDEKRAEDKRKKAVEKDALLKAQRERDEAKASLKVAEGEREALEQQVRDLQRENTMLVQRMGAGESGMDVVNKVKKEALGRARSSSSASSRSGKKALSSLNQHTPTGSMERLEVPKVSDP